MALDSASGFESYRRAFEGCSTYKDGAVNPTDFAAICHRYKQDHNTVMNSVCTDGEGRYSLGSFIHYMKQQNPQHSSSGPHPSSSHHGSSGPHPSSSHHGNSGPHPSSSHHGNSGPHPSSSHHSYYDQDMARFRVTSPPPHRPSSSSKFVRQGVNTSSTNSHHHHTTTSSSRHSSRYPMSPPAAPPASGGPPGGVGGGALAMSMAVPFDDSEDFTPEELQATVNKRQQEMTRTPEHYISAEEKTASRLDHDRLRLHSTPHASHINSTRLRPSPVSRGNLESPPPPHPSSHHAPHSHRMPGRPDMARSFRDDDSGDDEANQDTFYPPPTHSSRAHSSKKCKQCDRLKETYSRQLAEVTEDLRMTRQERERLEQNNERLRKELQMAQNADVAYGQLYHENEKLRQEIKRLRKESSDMDHERGLLDRQQYDDLKKAKEDVVEECAREKSAHKAYKKECAALKAEYSIIRLKNDEMQRSNWQLKDENQKLVVRTMEGGHTSPISRRPGDGESGESSVRSVYASEIGFHRQTHLRQTYHFSNGAGKNEVTRDSSRSHRSRLEMKRTSSEGKALDRDEPVKENAKHDNYRSSKAKTHKSAGTSDVGSVGDNLVFSMVSTVPDEQAQVFMILDEDVSKSVLPEGLPKDQELAIIYSLQNCHSIQEIIKCLVSYRSSSPSDKLSGFQVENEHLKSCVDHLMARLQTINNSFEKSKEDMTAMYHKANRFEANNMRLRHALKLCQQACEVYEILMDYKNLDTRNHGSANSSSYYPSYDSNFDTTTRSPDREGLTARNSLPGRARALLNQLECNPELQSYLPYGKLGKGSGGEYHAGGHMHWAAGTLSQNTGTTSGLSSMSGGTDIEITPSDLERLKHYSQALLHYESHLLSTMVAVDGLNGLATVKKQEHVADSLTPEQGGRGDPNDMEDAAHAEELCKIREEKAELKSQIYMMDQEKRRMELVVGQLSLQKLKSDKIGQELQFLIREEKRKRKRKRKSEAGIPSHDSTNMSELSIEYSSALEREKELTRRYEELFSFLRSHVKGSQETTDDLMRFVKELRRANSGLVDAFEKSKKRQQAEKRRMKQELVSYMNRLQATGGQMEEPSNGASVYP